MADPDLDHRLWRARAALEGLASLAGAGSGAGVVEVAPEALCALLGLIGAELDAIETLSRKAA